MINHEYEEYSEDNKRRFRVIKRDSSYKVVVEEYRPEADIGGYVESAGFYSVSDRNLHLAGTLEEGINIGRELIR